MINMTSRDFCYWLQGYFEITVADKTPPIYGLHPDQVKCFMNHLNMVFKHEIDPGMGPKPHQQTLSDIHSGLPRHLDTGPATNC